MQVGRISSLVLEGKDISVGKEGSVWVECLDKEDWT